MENPELKAVAESASKWYTKTKIINLKPHEIVVALLEIPTDDEAIEMLKAVYSADNIEGSQIEGVQEELFCHSNNDRALLLLEAIEEL